LYVKDSNGNLVERKTWPMTSDITSRNDVIIYKHEWVPIIEDIIIEVNQYLLTDEIGPRIVQTFVQGQAQLQKQLFKTRIAGGILSMTIMRLRGSRINTHIRCKLPISH